jgi:hypothetical protein
MWAILTRGVFGDEGCKICVIKDFRVFKNTRGFEVETMVLGILTV